MAQFQIHTASHLLAGLNNEILDDVQLFLCSCINGVELSDLLMDVLGVSVPLSSQGWYGKLVPPCWGVLVLG